MSSSNVSSQIPQKQSESHHIQIAYKTVLSQTHTVKPDLSKIYTDISPVIENIDAAQHTDAQYALFQEFLDINGIQNDMDVILQQGGMSIDKLRGDKDMTVRTFVVNMRSVVSQMIQGASQESDFSDIYGVLQDGFNRGEYSQTHKKCLDFLQQNNSMNPGQCLMFVFEIIIKNLSPEHKTKLTQLLDDTRRQLLHNEQNPYSQISLLLQSKKQLQDVHQDIYIQIKDVILPTLQQLFDDIFPTSKKESFLSRWGIRKSS